MYKQQPPLTSASANYSKMSRITVCHLDALLSQLVAIIQPRLQLDGRVCEPVACLLSVVRSINRGKVFRLLGDCAQ
jgi:hypothetical protein